MCQKTPATGREVHVRDHRRNGIWVEGIIRALRGSIVCEVNVDGQIWVRHRNYVRPWHAAKSSKLKMGPLDIMSDIFSLPSLENSRTPETQLSD